MLIRSLPLRGSSNSPPSRQPHIKCFRPAQLLGQQQHRCTSRLHAAADDASSKDYSPGELADYEEILRQKKAAKQQALQDLKRKRKFNPLHAKLKISPAEQAAEDADVQQPRPTAVTTQAEGDANAASISVASDGSSRGGTSDRPRFAARPRVAPGALQQQQQQQQAAAAPTKPPAEAALPAAAAAAAAEHGQLPAGVELLVEDDAAAAALDSAGYPADSVLSKMLAELMEGEVDEELSNDMLNEIPEVEALPTKIQRRKSPAQVKAAAIQQRALQQRMLRKRQAAALQQEEEDDEIPEEEESAEEQLMRAVASIQQQQQQHESSTAAGSGQAGDDEDDLDWEALGQYEQLEQYLGKLKKDQEVGPRRPPMAPAAAAPPLQPAAAAAAAPPPPPAAAAAAAQKTQPPVARQSFAAQHPSKPAAAAGDAAAAAQAGQPAAAGAAAMAAKRGNKASRMDKDLDELEELVSLLEAMESGTSSRQQQGLARKPARPAAASSTAAAAAAAAADPGETLLKALLGDDWEAELLDDLAAVIDDDEGESPPQQQQQGKLAAAESGSKQQQSAAADGEDEESPWADEVTALLLGLITISHEKYIKSQIPLPDFESVGEDERCATFWQAPWALFMVDDSSESCVEYVNAAAGAMLGGGYLDLFGAPTHELVAPDLTAQADWAYAMRKVEESAQFSVQLPQLQLRSLDGQPVIARDVTMWRVDSLEDTPIGMAVLVRSWERV